MATVLRPAFYEGQVLAAADLTATVEQARGAAARHNRLEHDWGIVSGLELTQDKRTDPITGNSYVAVILQPGVAVDGTGREIVVADAVALAEAAFRQVNGADQVPSSPALRPLYPVFLAGHDQAPQTTSLVSSTCGGAAGASRVEESFQIVFGRLGSEQSWDVHPQPAPDSGPGNGTSPWNVLLGFVTWDGTHFAGAFPDSDGVQRRYAGVRADTMIARSGRLTLRPDPEVTAGRAALVLDGASGLAVGPLTASGTLDKPLLQLNTRGDLSVAGTFTPQGTPARVLVVSGALTDGMLVPLPDGVTDAQVASGSVQLHVQVTPRLSPPITLPTGTWILGQVECAVDSAERRLRSTVRWYNISPAPSQQHVDLPAPADFLVIAAVAGSDAQAPGGRP